MTPQATVLDAPPVPASPGPAEPFRPIQYLGSKARLLGLIGSTLDAVDPARGPVLDLFSGSGVVAAHLAAARPVTAVDIQEYARVLAAALMTPERMPPAAAEHLCAAAATAAAERAGPGIEGLLRLEARAAQALEAGDLEPLCEILEGGSPVASRLGEGPDGGPLAAALDAASAELEGLRPAAVLTGHYGGVYFGYAQALQLDCLLEAARSLPAGPSRDTALAATLGAASETVTSVGSHFAQPVRPRDRDGRPKPGVLAAAERRRRRDVLAVFAERMARYAALPGAAHGASAVRADYRSFLESHRGEVAVAYADPPYTRDHYSRFYHVLETMALGDAPSIATMTVGGETRLSRGLYREQRHQSPFCIRSLAPAAFSALFEGARRFEAPLVVSYSPYESGTAARPRPRLLTIPDVVDLASEHFSRVEVRSGGTLSHSRFNAQRLNGEVNKEAEQLIVCRP